MALKNGRRSPVLSPHFSQALCRRLCGAVNGHFELTLLSQGRKYACG